MPTVCGKLMDLNIEMYFIFPIMLIFLLILCEKKLIYEFGKQKQGELGVELIDTKR